MRHSAMQITLLAICVLCVSILPVNKAEATERDEKVVKSIKMGLDWLSEHQSRRGHWSASGGQYRVAMTALAGMAMIAEGSTTTQGKYSENIRRAVNYLVDEKAHPNGLIGEPQDHRYTYGHGFSMLFLSQVLGEEEDAQRRKRLMEILAKAVEFTGRAQTQDGGWGYVSAKDGNGFDEGSTTITQVQGLRGCRNAGVPVPKEIIDKAVKYIDKCTTPDGGVRYRLQGGGGARPPITAAAIACLFNAGDYESDLSKRLMKFCKGNAELNNINNQSSGHWHYAHYYWAQVMYRGGVDDDGKKDWETYHKKVFAKLVKEQRQDGSWGESYVGPVYTTAVNLTIMQLDNAMLPIYQR